MEPPMEGEQQPSEMEVLRKLEDEHLRLQRQVRMIQIDREQRTMGVHPQFRRQDQLLRTLKKEYINLVKDLKIARSGAHKKNDKRLKSNLKRSIINQMALQNDCIGGLDLMSELDGLIQKDAKRMLELRKLVETNWGQLEERRTQSEQRLMSTENKLEAAMLRFNVVQGENVKIRECIEHMLQDRAIFNQSWAKMLTALSKGKKFLQDLFESSSVAYDQRDEWCRKLRSLQEKGKIDQTLQVQEMREIQKTLDHEMKLHEFLSSKGIMRINKKQERREIEEKKAQDEYFKKEIETHEKILDDVYEYTNESDIERIQEQFLSTEDQNFSVYLMVNEYCATNELLARDVQKIRRDCQDRRDWNDRMQSDLDQKLDQLRSKLEQQREKTAKLREREDEVNRRINNTMDQITEMFIDLQCSLEPYQNMLGDKVPSVWTFNLTLTLITEKIKELLQIAYYCERYKKGEKADAVHRSLLKKKKYLIQTSLPEIWTAAPLESYVLADPCSNCVEARWMSRFTESLEPPFDRAMTMDALNELIADPAYEKSERLHPLADCRLPKSRLLLARRYL